MFHANTAAELSIQGSDRPRPGTPRAAVVVPGRAHGDQALGPVDVGVVPDHPAGVDARARPAPAAGGRCRPTPRRPACRTTWPAARPDGRHRARRVQSRQLGREAAGRDRAPALDGHPDQGLALVAHRLRGTRPSRGARRRCSGSSRPAARRPRAGRSPRRCRRPARTVRPSRRAGSAPSWPARAAGSPPWPGSGRSRSPPALLVDPARHRRELRRAVAAGRDQRRPGGAVGRTRAAPRARRGLWWRSGVACPPVCLTRWAHDPTPRTPGRARVRRPGRAGPARAARAHRLGTLLGRPGRAARLVVPHRGAGRARPRAVRPVHPGAAGLGRPDRVDVRRHEATSRTSVPRCSSVTRWEPPCRPTCACAAPSSSAPPCSRTRAGSTSSRGETRRSSSRSASRRPSTRPGPVGSCPEVPGRAPAWPESELRRGPGQGGRGQGLPRGRHRDAATYRGARSSRIATQALVVTGDGEASWTPGTRRELARLEPRARRPGSSPGPSTASARPARHVPRGRRPMAGRRA